MRSRSLLFGFTVLIQVESVTSVYLFLPGFVSKSAVKSVSKRFCLGS